MTESHPEHNGHHPQPSEAEQIGDAVASRLGQMIGQVLPQVFNMLPPMLGQAVAQALQQAQPRRWCAPCLSQRLQWEAAHAADMDTALALAAKAAGIPEGDPRCGQLDVTPFLPAHLRSGSGHVAQMPQVMDWVTIAGGNAVCPMHVPGAPGTRGPVADHPAAGDAGEHGRRAGRAAGLAAPAPAAAERPGHARPPPPADPGAYRAPHPATARQGRADTETERADPH